MDYEKHIEMLLENMYKMLESHEVMEGFFSKRKEKKAAKKAAKEERRIQRIMDENIVIPIKDLPKHEKEFEDTVKFLRQLLKKEVPGCTFIDKDIKHTTHGIKQGYIEHRFTIKLFQMDDDNYDRYKSKSKCKELRDSENSWDYVDELLQDNHTRILDPIESKGFDNIYYDGSVMVKKKDGKDYISISLGDEATFDIDVFMYIVVKEEE